MSILKLSAKVFTFSLAASLLAAAALVGCNSMPEASFALAINSRLPGWFSIPPGENRADVSVTMDYFIKSTGRSATFILYDKTHHVLSKVTGTLKGSSPVPVDGSTPTTYPSFEVVTAGSITEVVEHRKMEPKFYITDDPAVLRALSRQLPHP